MKRHLFDALHQFREAGRLGRRLLRYLLFPPAPLEVGYVFAVGVRG